MALVLRQPTTPHLSRDRDMLRECLPFAPAARMSDRTCKPRYAWSPATPQRNGREFTGRTFAVNTFCQPLQASARIAFQPRNTGGTLADVGSFLGRNTAVLRCTLASPGEQERDGAAQAVGDPSQEFSLARLDVAIGRDASGAGFQEGLADHQRLFAQHVQCRVHR